MSLTPRAVRGIERAITDPPAAEEIIDALNAGAKPQGVAVANIGATANLTALAVAAAALTPLVPTTSVGSVTALTPGAGDVTTADADARFAEVETLLDNKADNADVETLRTEVTAALDLKTDNVDAETLRTEVEARLDVIEAKVDALLTSLRNAGLIA